MSIYNIKTGIGFDVHAFCEGRRLIVGGVDIPFDRGLAGHSDADVLAHAVLDSVIGVTLKRDIGDIFPDTDSAYKDADSLRLIEQAMELVLLQGYSINNIDATIIAQMPKMAPYINQMRENLARVLKMDVDDISIKATTSEKLGFTGRGEGIAAMAVATVCKERR